MTDAPKNPFTPVVGKVPLIMAGRDAVIEDVAEALSGEGNDPSTITLLVGARGTGKTALLSRFADEAGASGWIAARVSCSEGMLDDILVQTRRSANHLIETSSPRRIKSVGLPQIGSIEWEEPGTELANWRSRMTDLLELLSEVGAGLLITVDEANANSKEMGTLVASVQHFLGEGRRVALFMAGLPYGVSSLLTGKSTSFLRRAARYELGALSEYEVEEALLLTMSEGGKSFGPDALDKAVKAVNGFPFMLQLVGYRAWRLSRGSSTVSAENVEDAVRVAQKELRERVYDATWYELTEGDKAFLAAMLQDGSTTRQSDISKRLGKASGHVSKYKKRMLVQGVIQERSRGRLEFCLPGFREYFAERLAEG